MKKWSKVWALILALVVLGACLSSCGYSNWTREVNLSGDQKPAIKPVVHQNPTLKMEILDYLPELGITVIRFIDAGHTRYIAIKGNEVSVSSATSSGGEKQTYEDTSIPTIITYRSNK